MCQAEIEVTQPHIEVGLGGDYNKKKRIYKGNVENLKKELNDAWL
jgi:hypothetical protein